VAPQPRYRALVDEAVKYAGTKPRDESRRVSAFLKKTIFEKRREATRWQWPCNHA